jgi:flap endonuclease-1
MGNADLRDLAAIEEVAFDDLSGSTVAVDAHNWLYRYLTTTVKWTNEAAYTTADGTEVANLIGVVQGLPKFFEHDLTPIFVFDGAVTELKDDEVEKRREQREQYEDDLEAARERGDSVAVSRLESRTQRLTETITDTTRELPALPDGPTANAPAEGDAPLTLRQLTSKGNPERMDLAATLARHDLTWEQFVDVAILCGTDFNEGVSGIGPKTAVSLLTEHGDLFAALAAEGVEIEHADRIQQLFVDPAVVDVEPETTIDPDVAAGREYVVDQWGVDPDEVERGFERIKDAVVQTGLDNWT